MALDDPSNSTMRRVFERQHAASRSGPMPDVAARRLSLATLYDLVRDNANAFAQAIAEDFGGRAHRETEILEAIPTLNAVRNARKCVSRWMKPERRRVDWLFQPARAWVRYEPLGVVGIMSPWNFPLLLSLVPLVNVLSAGNRAMIKPSELTPAFSDLLARLVAQHFDPDHVAVIPGGVDVARAFSSLPFDHLLFTGSTSVGREVMRAAAQNLTPVTLELGGKSPAIVIADFPLRKAARSIAFGKWLNAGQTCVAPDYVLVPADRAAAFADAVIEEARRAYPSIADPDYTNVITERHQARLNAAIEEAAAAGAVIIRHGGHHAGTRKIAPTVVLGAPASGLLMREEIFGPILPIVPYERLEDALAFINARDRPLALYCFTNDKRVRALVLDGATSGGVTLNGTLLHAGHDGLPFGGIGASGMGFYHGRDGFLRFSHARAVHAIGAVNPLEWLGPPWGTLAARAARFLLRRS
jgi:coniferyl-aldehyde dehydrogenase